MSGLEVQCRLRRGAFALDVEFDAPGHGVTSLFGPSGSGKTTILRCLAGLEPSAQCRVVVRGESWHDLPPHLRAIGYVFQEPSLFPHLSVRGNLRYGYRRVPRPLRRIALHDAIEWLGLAPLLARRPASLSGGECQRVAIARAVLTSPRLLLMDEPLSALDEESRRAILPYLERVYAELAIPVVYVTHSLREVARLADWMVWLEHGRVRESGPLRALLTSVDLATSGGDAVGAVVDATVARHDQGFFLTELDSSCGTIVVRRVDRPLGAPVRVQILARDVSLALKRERGSSILNEIACRVVDVHDAEPGQVTVRLAAGPEAEPTLLLARITKKSATVLALAPGVPVFARVKSVGTEPR